MISLQVKRLVAGISSMISSESQSTLAMRSCSDEQKRYLSLGSEKMIPGQDVLATGKKYSYQSSPLIKGAGGILLQ
jgi:hypothetical protein